jgi:hypothetical protein
MGATRKRIYLVVIWGGPGLSSEECCVSLPLQ